MQAACLIPGPAAPLLLTPPTPVPYTFHKAESKFHKAETVEGPGKRGKIDQSPPRKDLR
ncbi:MAG: hypothetical protein K0Q84_448 [Arthrobacter sp.]|nr:hypothetical protein [Arthrobacter sp.]